MEQEKREQVIQGLADMLRKTHFETEFKVTKEPKGIKVIIDVTQEQMNDIVRNIAKKARGEKVTKE